jgi:NAD(P)-dependent dehydrogenase (short-subunit alcohol dehydrogenase family)
MKNNIFSLEGKTIVFTGGVGYIGSTVVRNMLDFGASVVIADIVDKKPEEVVDDPDLSKNLYVLQCDLSSTEAIAAMFKKAKELCGRIDVLVNCAAYGGGAGGDVKTNIGSDISSISDEQWARGVDGVLNVTFRCLREVLPYFEEAGKGNVINVASMYGMIAPDFGIYGSSGQASPPTYGPGKAGVLQLTRYAASNLSKKNIRVNAVTPGTFANPKGLKDDGFKEKLESKNMLGRLGEPQDMAGAMVFLASDASGYMTGANIVVDGGWTAW